MDKVLRGGSCSNHMLRQQPLSFQSVFVAFGSAKLPLVHRQQFERQSRSDIAHACKQAQTDVTLNESAGAADARLTGFAVVSNFFRCGCTLDIDGQLA